MDWDEEKKKIQLNLSGPEACLRKDLNTLFLHKVTSLHIQREEELFRLSTNLSPDCSLLDLRLNWKEIQNSFLKHLSSDSARANLEGKIKNQPESAKQPKAMERQARLCCKICSKPRFSLILLYHIYNYYINININININIRFSYWPENENWDTAATEA